MEEKPRVSLRKPDRQEHLIEITPIHYHDEIIPVNDTIVNGSDIEYETDKDCTPTQNWPEQFSSVNVITDNGTKHITLCKIMEAIRTKKSFARNFHDPHTSEIVIKKGNMVIQDFDTDTYSESKELTALHLVLSILVSPNGTLQILTDTLDQIIAMDYEFEWFIMYRAFLAKIQMGDHSFEVTDLGATMQSNGIDLLPAKLHNFITDYTSRLLYREQENGTITLNDNTIKFLFGSLRKVYADTISNGSNLVQWLYGYNKHAAMIGYKHGILTSVADKIRAARKAYKLKTATLASISILIITSIFTLSKSLFVANQNNTLYSVLAGVSIVILLTVAACYMLVIKDKYKNAIADMNSALRNITTEYFNEQHGSLYELYKK
ncbi:hypothetical protein J6A31_09015 [bacterium]|nr:hypothetical protein [bacterium]